jgi:glutamyl-Q tRNA(Asp) synthetase
MQSPPPAQTDGYNGRYIGRFAPSPTGALHAGSLVAALASWLDARSHGGKWLVRIEDVDTPRCIPGASHEILRQLAACGLWPDEPPVFQSQRGSLYQAALDKLIQQQAAYPCACSRKDIEATWAQRGIIKTAHEELPYPGTCRSGLHGKSVRAWRFALPAVTSPENPFFKPNQPLLGIKYAQSAIDLRVNKAGDVSWQDRCLGAQSHDVASQVGDFVLRRADGLWAYQLAVVVDDAAQGITHVVRGEDLADNTARQILLQQALGYNTPQYLHTPLVLAPDGSKLSKQTGAEPLALANESSAIAALQAAAKVLGIPLDLAPAESTDQLLRTCTTHWQYRCHTNHFK